MYVKRATLDDLLNAVIVKVTRGRRIRPSRGPATELFGVLLEVSKPRARLSRTEKRGHVFSCLGELLWYLAKTNRLDYISYYVPRYVENTDDGSTVHGAYGPRLFHLRGQDQVDNVLALLRRNRDSRRAVIQLFDSSDLPGSHKDVPCTCTLQFTVRDRRLQLLTSMRSNDAFIGLPHDVFAFTMLQELIARSLGVEIGTYKHAVGSLHLYDSDRAGADQYLREGLQETISMPPMPFADPWPSVSLLLQAEAAIRLGQEPPPAVSGLDSYWQDLVRLLKIYKHYKRGENEKIAILQRQMTSRVYDPYIDQKEESVHTAAAGTDRPLQLSLL